MTKFDVLNNLKKFIGEKMEIELENEIVCAFGDCYGEDYIFVEEIYNNVFDYTAYAENSDDKFMFELDDDNIILGVCLK